jgi:hypothetical protein
MARDLSRRVGLFVLSGPGAGIVFEKGDDSGTPLPVTIAAGRDAAHRWAEGHYEDVEWEGPDRGVASIGAFAERSGRPPATVTPNTTRSPRLTYDADGLRTYLPELLEGERGPVIVQRCEEHIPESGRWEPFLTTLWEATW